MADVARIRTIKPEFWSDEKLSECSLSARLLFMGLISFSDDAGRMEYSPARIRMQVFPCGTVKLGALTEWLGELREHSMIRVYVIEGKEYLDIPNFTKHQKINRPTPSKLPSFSGSAPEQLSEDSVSPTAGMEGKGKDSKRALKRSSRVPPEFEPDREYAKVQIPDLDVDREVQKFRDWEFKTPRSDWPAVWRTWIANALEKGGYARINGKPLNALDPKSGRWL